MITKLNEYLRMCECKNDHFKWISGEAQRAKVPFEIIITRQTKGLNPKNSEIKHKTVVQHSAILCYCPWVRKINDKSARELKPLDSVHSLTDTQGQLEPSVKVSYQTRWRVDSMSRVVSVILQRCVRFLNLSDSRTSPHGTGLRLFCTGN